MALTYPTGSETSCDSCGHLTKVYKQICTREGYTITLYTLCLGCLVRAAERYYEEHPERIGVGR